VKNLRPPTFVIITVTGPATRKSAALAVFSVGAGVTNRPYSGGGTVEAAGVTSRPYSGVAYISGQSTIPPPRATHFHSKKRLGKPWAPP
jgi:hypothetical protein